MLGIELLTNTRVLFSLVFWRGFDKIREVVGVLHAIRVVV